MKKKLIKLASYLKDSKYEEEYKMLKKEAVKIPSFGDVYDWFTSEEETKYIEASIAHIIGKDFCEKKMNISFDEDLAESLQKGKDTRHSTKVSFRKIQNNLGSNADDQKKWENTKKIYKEEQEDFTINFVRNFSTGFGDRVDCEFTLTIDTNRQKYKVYLLEDAFYNNHLYVKTQYFDIDYKKEEERQRKQKEEIERRQKDLDKQREEQEKEIKENERKIEESKKSFNVVKRDGEENKDDVFYYTKVSADTVGPYYYNEKTNDEAKKKLYVEEARKKNITVEKIK